MELQAKLLRIVQDGEFERLGSVKTTRVDVRLIAATHRDLAERVKERDLPGRSVLQAQCLSDSCAFAARTFRRCSLLVTAFIREFERRMGKKIRTVPSRMMDELKRYPWPGNVRELRNVIERAVIVTSGDKLNLQMPKLLNPVFPPP